MGRYCRNLFAYIRGLLCRLVSLPHGQRRIAAKVRIFLSAVLEIDRRSSLTIGRGAKIRERAYVSVKQGGSLEIGAYASVGMDCKISAHEKIVIGEGTLLSPNVLIYDHDHVFDSEGGVQRKAFRSAPVVIGKNCWIGANTVLLKGTVLGDNCVVGAGSVIRGVYPDNVILTQKRETTCIRQRDHRME